jgi:Flp pilus assembly protein TadD
MSLAIPFAISCASVEDKTKKAVTLGDALIAEGKCDEATQQYATAAELAPASLDIRLKLARTYARCGADMAAINEYKAAISCGAAELDVYREIVPLLIKIGESQGAETILKKIIEKAPSDCVAHNNLGVVLYRQKKYPEARKAFEEAIKRNPSHCDSYLNLASLLENEFNDIFTSTRYYKKYLSLRPDAPNAAQIKDRIVQNELKLLKEGSSDTSFDDYMDEGQQFLAAGQFKEAEASFRAALRARSTSASARTNLGVALMEQGKLDEAESVLEKCLELGGGSAECAYQLGWVYKLGGDDKKAVKLWEKALSIDPTFQKAKKTLDLYDK